MLIRKTQQPSDYPSNNIHDAYNTSSTDTYSCNYINGLYNYNYLKSILLDFCHPVGEIFTTTDSNFNPNTEFGGTWEKLTADAYFKIVTSNAGSLGGTSSDHKIPLSSIPSHNHLVTDSTTSYGAGTQSSWRCLSWSGTSHDYWQDVYSGNAGGGNAYYPYYYGVIAWKRTS